MLESIDNSMEQLRSIFSSKSFKTGTPLQLNNINIDALKDLIHLLNEYKNVSLLAQTGTRPSLHMAYVGINKLEHHLNGNDVDENGEVIPIDDRHEGNIKRCGSRMYSLFQVPIFFENVLVNYYGVNLHSTTGILPRLFCIRYIVD